ncbi:PAAR domain-containing protein [Cognatishimia sp. MH4019]|uniref:PAAR domain-containing protein n=1 Tax=Cognatishimia sp. MH4019 TaxID=2854030 RepID=UPI001CD54632|nr:PAAR domain-containing protein [Cognatishimia sp. MH4019]
MPKTARISDVCTGHGCWPSRGNAQGSSDVYIEGLAAHRQGDAWLPHTCPSIPETHAGALGSGSSTVYVNGKQLGRVGDPVSCGSSVASGASTVFAGG